MTVKTDNLNKIKHDVSLYVQNVYAPDPDPEMKIEKYVRTFEQNEDLGLNDMKTEGYGQAEN